MAEPGISAIFVCVRQRERSRVWSQSTWQRAAAPLPDHTDGLSDNEGQNMGWFPRSQNKWKPPCLLSLVLCQTVMQISLKMPPLSVDIPSSCPSQQQLNLQCYILHCLVNNGALSVIKQVQLVWLMHHVREKKNRSDHYVYQRFYFL